MNPDRAAPARARRVREGHDPRIPALVVEHWAADLPWLVQGTTTRGKQGDAFDLGLFAGGSSLERAHERWRHLLAATGMSGAAHARQVHDADVRIHDSIPVGLSIVDACDGHVTRKPGLLLAVTVADCVPIFVVDPVAHAVAVLHAGWRGAACGVLERGLAAVSQGARTGDLLVHLGPAICGRCYEVGPEVFEALGEPRPARAAMLDLRTVLARRAVERGVDSARLTISEHCTRCTGSGLFSHRGGDGGRQVGYIGMRA